MISSPRLFVGALILAATGGALGTFARDARAAETLELIDGTFSPLSGYIHAGEQGANFRLLEAMRLRLAPQTEMKLIPQTQFLRLTTLGYTRITTVVLRSGQLWLDLRAPHHQEAVLVTTPEQLNVIVQSGEAFVANENGQLVVAHTEGDLWGRKKAGWQRIPKGEVRVYTALDSPPAISAVLSTPRLNAARMVLFSSGEPVKLNSLDWEAVPGAAQYEVELSGDTPTTRIFAHSHELPVGLSALPGTTQLRVRAIDPRGIPSAWSTPATVRVVGVALPPGANVRSPGIIELGEGQQVTFEHAEGLMLSYRGQGQAVPATTPVGLYQGAQTVVSLIQRGLAKAPAVVTLVPRSVYAAVEVGPKKAIWPRDPIHMRVKLTNRPSNPRPGAPEAVPTVTLDTVPLDVDWQKDGEDLVATVLPQAKCGHCVLRVEVNDQYGMPLGRDFVEIVEQGRPRQPRTAASGKGASRITSSSSRQASLPRPSSR